jgi:nicotinamide phosphoribosyltransferase
MKMNNKVSLIIMSDSYKYSHFKLFPQGTEINNSYIESRGVELESGLPKDTEITFFGLQAYIQEYLTKPITMEDIDEAEKLITAHGLPFNRVDWETIVNEFEGLPPIYIEALPEGTVVKPGVAMVQVRNTDPRFAWLASFMETAILRAVWYPTTVATVSREAKKIIKKFLDDTADTTEGLPFKLHDFGARGVSSSETAMLGGMAHLVNFMGTDTVEALIGAMRYYGATGPVGFSIPASEHSTITSWGKENEVKAYENMLDVFAKPGAILACVSDSYDIYKSVSELWPSLKDKIVASGATLVIRPDSGDPVTVVTKIMEILAEKFGYTVNSKGFKVLNNVRVIQGDGINVQEIKRILYSMKMLEFSADNIAFGMGGALLQKVNRDTLKFAMKTNAVRVNGEWRDVFKHPVDSEFKKSKAGVLTTILRNGEYITLRADDVPYDANEPNQMQPVFSWDGFEKTQTFFTFDEVRTRAEVK